MSANSPYAKGNARINTVISHNAQKSNCLSNDSPTIGANVLISINDKQNAISGDNHRDIGLSCIRSFIKMMGYFAFLSAENQRLPKIKF
jgi:hypothetical protein